MSQVFAFALHVLLLIIFVAITGTTRQHSLAPHAWVFIALGVLVAAALLVLAFPAGRRLVQSRVAPAISQVVPRLLDVAQQPAKLAEGIGGALLVTGGNILCLDASVRALGASVPLASVAVVYLTGNAIASVVPTPGGLGAVEAALSAGLTAAGLARHHGGQRGAAVPHPDLLAAGGGRLGGPALPPAPRHNLAPPQPGPAQPPARALAQPGHGQRRGQQDHAPGHRPQRVLQRGQQPGPVQVQHLAVGQRSPAPVTDPDLRRSSRAGVLRLRCAADRPSAAPGRQHRRHRQPARSRPRRR